MKKSVAVVGIGVFSIWAGITMKDTSKLFSLILVISGIVALLVAFLLICTMHADKCPKCGTILYRNARVHREKRDGLIRCPKCNSLVRVEPINKKYIYRR